MTRRLDHLRDSAITAYQAGEGLKTISDKLGISTTPIQRWLREANVEKHRAGGSHFHGTVHRLRHEQLIEETEDPFFTVQQGDDRARWNLGDGCRRVLKLRAS